MNKLQNIRVPACLDEKTLTDLDAYRASLESRCGLRVSRSSAASSLIRTALAAVNSAEADRQQLN